MIILYICCLGILIRCPPNTSIFIKIEYYPDDQMIGLAQDHPIPFTPSIYNVLNNVAFIGDATKPISIKIKNNTGNMFLCAKITIGSSFFSTTENQFWKCEDGIDKKTTCNINGLDIYALDIVHPHDNLISLFFFSIPVQPYCSSLILPGEQNAIIYISLSNPHIGDIFHDYTILIENSVSSIYFDSITYSNSIFPNGQLYERNKIIDIGKAYELEQINFKAFTHGDMFINYQLISGIWIQSCKLTVRVCYEGCKRCDNTSPAINDNQCYECDDGYIQTSINNNKVTCSKQTCPTGNWFIDEFGEKKCISDCIPDYPFNNPITSQCVNNCPQGTYLYNKECIPYCPPSTFLINDKCYNDCYPIPPKTIHNAFYIDQTLPHCLNFFHNNILDYKSLLKPVNGINFIFEVYEYDNPLNVFINVSSINLTHIVNLLGTYSKPLIIAKYDLLINESLTNQVEYAIFDSKGNLIDLSVLNHQMINITYPIKQLTRFNITMAEEILNTTGFDILDYNSGYYTDHCKSLQYNNSDVTIKDRREHFFPNVSFCETNCDYIQTDYSILSIICKCKIKTITSPYSNNPFIFSSFQSISQTNLIIGKCYHLFSSDEVIQSTGFWFLGLVLLFQSIMFFVYLRLEVKAFYSIMHESSYLFKRSHGKKEICLPSNNDIYYIDILNRQMQKYIDIMNNYQYMRLYIESRKQLYYNYSYQLSTKIDNRTMWMMMKDILIQTIPIIRVFIHISKYELFSIKMSHLLFMSNVSFNFNALLFNDTIISNKYFEGHFNYTSILINSIYSYIALRLVSLMMNKLIIYYHILEELTLEVYQKKKYFKHCKKLLNGIRIKLILYYIISLSLSLSSWYYSTIFCCIYKKCNIGLIIGYFLTTGFSLLLTLLLGVLSAVLRYCSLSSFTKYSRLMYSVSTVFQLKLSLF